MRITQEDLEKQEKERLSGTADTTTEDKAAGNANTLQSAPRESDLTKAQKRQLEKEKIKGMPPGKKVEYLWMYYKWVLAIILAVIFIGSMVGSAIKASGQEQLLYVTVIDGGMGDGEALAEALKSSFSAEEEDYVTVDTSMFTDNTGSLNYTSTMQFTTKMAAAEIDVVICSQSIYDNYEEQGIALNYDEVMGKEFCTNYADQMYKNSLEVGENEVLKQYGFEFYEPMYVFICSNSEKLENIQTFIEFLGF